MARNKVEHTFKKVDWSHGALSDEHMWVDTQYPHCQAIDFGCLKEGPRVKCIACKMVVHVKCIHLLGQEPIEYAIRSKHDHDKPSQKFQLHYRCKPTFQEASARDYRDKTAMEHHWVYRFKQEGNCKKCKKPFGGSQRKEAIAMSCSWCKDAYHAKTCFTKELTTAECTLGIHANIIVRPAWIVKILTEAYRCSVQGHGHTRTNCDRGKKKDKLNNFVIKHIPSPHAKPLVVIVDSKCGDDAGMKHIHSLSWWLNPRQVFDLTFMPPEFALELYKNVRTGRLVVSGDDDTVMRVQRVLQSTDLLHFPLAVLPCGPVNDIAKSLNWNKQYINEEAVLITRFLHNVEDAPVIGVDIWNIQVVDGPNTDMSEIMYKYMGIGSHAHMALKWNDNSLKYLKTFYDCKRSDTVVESKEGKKEIKLPEHYQVEDFSDLTKYIKLECDGVDFTSKVQSMKLQCILFLNIPRYFDSVPWGPQKTLDTPQSYNDGMLEVVGLTKKSVGTVFCHGHGEKIARCKEVILTTYKPLPMQVDTQPRLVQPSTIRITFRNKWNMLINGEGGITPSLPSVSQELNINVQLIMVNDFTVHHDDRSKLAEASVPLGQLRVEEYATLAEVRMKIDAKDPVEFPFDIGRKDPSCVSDEWCFLDSTTAECFFRIRPDQESMYYVTDICTDVLYILGRDPDYDMIVTSGNAGRLVQFIQSLFSRKRQNSEKLIVKPAASPDTLIIVEATRIRSKVMPEDPEIEEPVTARKKRSLESEKTEEPAKTKSDEVPSSSEVEVADPVRSEDAVDTMETDASDTSTSEEVQEPENTEDSDTTRSEDVVESEEIEGPVSTSEEVLQTDNVEEEVTKSSKDVPGTPEVEAAVTSEEVPSGAETKIEVKSEEVPSGAETKIEVKSEEVPSGAETKIEVKSEEVPSGAETKIEVKRSGEATGSVDKIPIATTRPIRMSIFVKRVMELRYNSYELLIKEWIDLDKYTVILTASPSAISDVNRKKNRYEGILPYDHSRVTLQVSSSACSDYINASFIPGDGDQKYIATQAPLQETFGDFWLMIWQCRCKTIVMLGSLIEQEIVKIDRYWPQCPGKAERYGDIWVELIRIVQYDKVIIRTYRIAQNKENRYVSQYCLPDFDEDCSKPPVTHVINFIHKLRSDVNAISEPGPIVVHCSAGMGRTGVFIALDYFQQRIAEMTPDDVLDVFEFVLKMRNNRLQMVQNLKQYMFIYEVLVILVRSRKDSHLHLPKPRLR